MTRPPFTWQLHWPTTLFVAALLPCLLALGFWQLHRADEKRELQRQFDALRAQAPLAAAQLTDNAAPYTRVQLAGHFDNAHSFLLDNRVSHGRVGFEVLTPFITDGQTRIVLVNRGWIAGDPSRQTLPTIPPEQKSIALHGYIYRDSDNRLVAPEAAAKNWPRMIEQIDIDAMQQQLGASALPYTVRLDADSPAALMAEWPVVTSSPERHTGYAVQWFAMATALVLLWFWRSTNAKQSWFGGADY